MQVFLLKKLDFVNKMPFLLKTMPKKQAFEHF